jgi:hypothetical protein
MKRALVLAGGGAREVAADPKRWVWPPPSRVRHAHRGNQVGGAGVSSR